MSSVAAVLPLRECLTDCQVNRGLDPIFCQEECGALTPGEATTPTAGGPCNGFLDCFLKGFEVPSSVEIGGGIGDVLRPINTTLLIAAGLGLIVIWASRSL